MGNYRTVTGDWRPGQDKWHSPRLAAWAGWLVVVLAGLLYLFTLDGGLRPDELAGGDLITHQYAQVQARPGNAPGYPLYTLGGWLWFRLTGLLFDWAANPIQRLASYSTVWALAALFVLYHLLLRVTRGRWPVAALVTLFYAVTYFFWYYSVTTEQYTSAILQTLLIVWLAWRWDDQVAVDSPAADRTLLWLALIAGTCLANLVTVLFILPPLIWFVLNRQPGLLRRGGQLLRMAGLALLPLVSYGYVYWRGATHPEWRGAGDWPSAGAWFLDFLTTHQGRDELAPGLTLSRFVTAEFPALMWGELTVVGLVAGLVGLWWLGRRRGLLIAGTLAIYFVFCWVDRFGNWYQVIMPAYALLVPGLAGTATRIIDAAGVGRVSIPADGTDADVGRVSIPTGGTDADVGRVSIPAGGTDADVGRVSIPAGGLGTGPAATESRPTAGAELVLGVPGARVVRWIVVAALVALVGYRLAASLPRADQSWRTPSEDTGLDPGWAVLADGPPPGAVVVADHAEWLALTYLMDVWGASPAVTPQPLCRPLAGAETYITRRAVAADPACLAEGHRYAAGAELIRVQTEPERRLPATARPVDLSPGGGLHLIGYAAAESRPPVALRWRLSLYWQAAAPLDADYTVSVRPQRDGQPLSGLDGGPLIQDHQPAWNAYPTSRWRPGEVVRDDYVFDLPPGDARRPDAVQIVVYRALPGSQGGTTFETLGEIELGDIE